MTQIGNHDKYAARKRYLQLVDVVSEVKITTADNGNSFKLPPSCSCKEKY